MSIQVLKVSEVAAMLGVSRQRVRLLLSQGRLRPAGKDSKTGEWGIWPTFTVQRGKRGPRFRAFARAQ
ncbi:MAG: helix-turn-helix domain-containing protein [Burkholderiales bacterium]|nr:helix-turn-helix domain-containing protein [Burkholderiales bacterium]